MKTSSEAEVFLDGGVSGSGDFLHKRRKKRTSEAGCRRLYDAKFKAQVAREVMKEQRSLTAIARENGIPKGTLALWKDELMARMPALFDDHMLRYRKTRREAELEREVADLRLRLRLAKARKGR